MASDREELAGILEDYDEVYWIISPTAVTTHRFPLRGYAGHSGRLDVIVRTAQALYGVSQGEALLLATLLGPPRPPLTLAYTGECMQPAMSERALAAVTQRVLAGRRVSSCIAFEAGVEDVLSLIKIRGLKLVLLKEGGLDLSRASWVLSGKAAYVAGAHVDIPGDIERLLVRYSNAVVSLGPVSLLTSHAIAFVAWARRVCGSRVESIGS